MPVSRGWIPLLSLALALAASAASADAPATGPRTNLQVTLWETGVVGEREALTELLFSFQRVNPDVIVCLEWRDATLQSEWIPRWCGDYRQYAPDVTVMSEQLAWQYRHDLLELPDEFGRELRRDFEAPVLRRLPGRTRGVPWRVSTRALYYRPDLLAAAELEVPETLEQLVTRAKELADPPARFGLGIPGPLGGGEELLHALARAAGAVPVGDPDGGPALSDGSVAERRRPDYEAALELLVELQSSGALQPETLTWSEAELAELFAGGRLAMLIAPIETTRLLQAQEEPPEWAVAPMPLAAGGSGSLSVDWLVAFEDTDRRENALRLMRYLAERESQRMLVMTASVPAMRSLIEELRDTSPWSAHLTALNDADGVPLARWQRLRPELAHALAYALSGRLTPREALAEAIEIAE